MTNSDQSLSVVLPVYNAQNSLPHLINQMLDILPDLASEFEVLVVDDGSTDQTEEVARDIATQYPQVRVTRHTERLGGDEVIRTGYARTRGKVVIVQQENTAFGEADVKRLWQLHADQAESAVEIEDPSQLDSVTENYLAEWSAAFRNKMKPPSREQMAAMARKLVENSIPNAAADERHAGEHFRADQGSAAKPGSRRSFGPPQPRYRSARK